MGVHLGASSYYIRRRVQEQSGVVRGRAAVGVTSRPYKVTRDS